MAKIIIFDDGTTIRGKSEAELVRNAEAHIRKAHPGLSGQLSPEEILAMAVDTDDKGDDMATQAGYDFEGTLLEACSCQVLCPCWIGEDPDGGSCDAFNAYHFDRGTIAGVDVAGLSCVRVVRIPGNVLTPNSWKQVIFIDEKASDEQFQAIADVFEGRLGGPLADLAGLVAETLAVERAAITHQINDGQGTLRVGDSVVSTMHPYKGPEGKTTTLRDSVFSTVPGSPAYVAVADTHKVNLPQYGMEWEFEHRNAIQADWKLVHNG